MARRAVLLCVILLIPSLTLAQVSHPASDVTPGDFQTGDYRINGFWYLGGASAGLTGDTNRVAILAPDGSPKIYVYNANVTVPNLLAVGSSGVRFSDGSIQTTAAESLWSQSGSNIYYNTGNVGIGVSTSLDSRVTVGIDAASGLKEALRLFDHSGDGAPETGGLRVWYSGTTGEVKFESTRGGYGQPATGRTPRFFTFYTHNENQNVPDEKVRITGDGNIGIGTTSPSAQLHVNTDIMTGAGSASTPSLRFGGDSASGFFRISSGDVAWSESGAAKFVIVDGNVGIGTTNPAGKLDVNGDLRVQSSYASGPFIADVTSGNAGEVVLSSNSKIRINLDRAGNGNQYFTISRGGSTDLSGPTLFRVTDNGGVGDLSFSGTLTSGSVPWARLTSFPGACPAGQFVTTVGGTLTCAAPSGGFTQWHVANSAGTTQFTITDGEKVQFLGGGITSASFDATNQRLTLTSTEADTLSSVRSRGGCTDCLVAGDIAANAIGASELASSGVGAGTYGSATQVGQVAVDADGRITSASNVAISGVSPGGAAGGDLTGTYPNPQIQNRFKNAYELAVATSGKEMVYPVDVTYGRVGSGTVKPAFIPGRVDIKNEGYIPTGTVLTLHLRTALRNTGTAAGSSTSIVTGSTSWDILMYSRNDATHPRKVRLKYTDTTGTLREIDLFTYADNTEETIALEIETTVQGDSGTDTWRAADILVRRNGAQVGNTVTARIQRIDPVYNTISASLDPDKTHYHLAGVLKVKYP